MKEKFPYLPERISGLADIAYNLWWSWHPSARMLFKLLDRVAWKESRHNPVLMLKDLPSEAFNSAAQNADYLHHYDYVMSRFREDIETRICWFVANIREPTCQPIAYFSAEYGLHHSLPFYAGGLGFLAGDYIKECSDLGVPWLQSDLRIRVGICDRRSGWMGGRMTCMKSLTEMQLPSKEC